MFHWIRRHSSIFSILTTEPKKSKYSIIGCRTDSTKISTTSLRFSVATCIQCLSTKPNSYEDDHGPQRSQNYSHCPHMDQWSVVNCNVASFLCRIAHAAVQHSFSMDYSIQHYKWWAPEISRKPAKVLFQRPTQRDIGEDRWDAKWWLPQPRSTGWHYAKVYNTRQPRFGAIRPSSNSRQDSDWDFSTCRRERQ